MKKYIPVISCLVITLFFCCGTVFLAQISMGTPVVPSESQEVSPPVILVDAGHGGFDGGAVSIDGKNEKDYNLSFALKLADMLRAEGFTVVLTRQDDNGTQDAGLGSIREKKVSDIRNRMKLMDSYENCIFISLHQNYFSDSSCHGAQVFYSPNLPQSKEIAEAVQKNISLLVEPDNTRAIKRADRSIYLLKNARRPAILIECGFISNYQNAKKLEEENFQKQMTFAICDAIYNYIYYSEVNHGS